MAEVAFSHVEKVYPDGTQAVFDLELTLADRELLCVLGPSGCGKSSTLRMLAGLETVTRGEIRIDGARINEVPPQRRDIAMVFENYALYPHLNVFDNLAMPLRAQGVERAAIRSRVQAVAETLQITDQLRKRPSQLSGGQRQRVGLGRAIVRTPRIFLMDEPLGHLEAYLRVQLRSELRRLHERLGATTFYITHDQEEAAAISDRIAVMSEGRLQQTGSLLELLDNPANRFVAEFIGNLPINILPAALRGGAGSVAVAVDGASVALPAAKAAMLAEAAADTAAGLELGIRPVDMRLHRQPGPDRIAATVAVLEPQGDTTVVIADGPGGRISAVAADDDVPAVGTAVFAALDADRIHLFGADGRNLLARTG
ncbi:MAG: ABC transporter ATP-binding protein [Alphaproteobacteria bacterium]